MNWEDTVMSKEILSELNSNMPPEAKYGEVFEVIARTQTNITGDIAYKAGIKEVVEWLQEQNDVDDEIVPYYVINKKVLEKQSKEWGL